MSQKTYTHEVATENLERHSLHETKGSAVAQCDAANAKADELGIATRYSVAMLQTPITQ